MGWIISLKSIIQCQTVNTVYGVKKSTSVASMELTEKKITGCTDNREFAVGVFNRFKKKSIRYHKSCHVIQTIRKIWYNWCCAGLGEKLYGKQAAVQMNGYISTCLYITVGVPQGSVVGSKIVYFGHKY